MQSKMCVRVIESHNAGFVGLLPTKMSHIDVALLPQKINALCDGG